MYCCSEGTESIDSKNKSFPNAFLQCCRRLNIKMLLVMKVAIEEHFNDKIKLNKKQTLSISE